MEGGESEGRGSKRREKEKEKETKGQEECEKDRGSADRSGVEGREGFTRKRRAVSTHRSSRPENGLRALRVWGVSVGDDGAWRSRGRIAGRGLPIGPTVARAAGCKNEVEKTKYQDQENDPQPEPDRAAKTRGAGIGGNRHGFDPTFWMRAERDPRRGLLAVNDARIA
jgi:hypothetical protein